MSEAEKDTREWTISVGPRVFGGMGQAQGGNEVYVPKSALTAALDRVESLERTIREGLALEDQAIAQRDEAEAKLTAALEERDEQKRINEFDIHVANVEMREALERAEKERDEAQAGLDQVATMANDLAGDVTRAEAALAEALDVIAAANSSDPYESFPWGDLEPILRKHGWLS